MKIRSKIIANPDNELIPLIRDLLLPNIKPEDILTINIQRRKGIEQVEFWYDSEVRPKR